MIKLRFVTTDSIISAAIRLVTWSEYSHVELVTDNGYIAAHKDGGVSLLPYNYCKPSKSAYGYVNCSPIQAEKVVEFMNSQIGKPYDTLNILGILFHRDWKKNSSWCCSELVAAAFDYAGYPLLERDPPNRVTPGDLYHSPLIEIESG